MVRMIPLVPSEQSKITMSVHIATVSVTTCNIPMNTSEAIPCEPLLSSARSCLEHRHAYVRKNAVWAIASIYQHSEPLIPDAPELIQTFLESETDGTCKRNAFAALMSISHQKALEYLASTFDSIPNTDELLQLVELEFIRKDAVQNSQNKVGRFRRKKVEDLDCGLLTGHRRDICG